MTSDFDVCEIDLDMQSELPERCAIHSLSPETRDKTMKWTRGFTTEAFFFRGLGERLSRGFAVTANPFLCSECLKLDCLEFCCGSLPSDVFVSYIMLHKRLGVLRGCVR